MKNLVEIMKGFFIGIAGVMPGVSGGAFAMALGIYDKLIDAVANFFKTPIKSIKSVWQYIIGVGLGSIFSVLALSYILNRFPVPTTMLFIGLILGTLPIILNQVNDKDIKTSDIFAFVIAMCFILAISFFKTSEKIASINNIFVMIIIGIIYVITTVVPGVSGTMILMGLGYYEPMLDLFSSFITNILTFSFKEASSQLILLIPFVISVIISFVLIAKLVKWLIKKYNSQFNWVVLGVIVASPFPVIFSLNLYSMTIASKFISIFTFVCGILIASAMSKYEK